MLPFDSTWELLMKIVHDGPEINTSRKIEGYNDELHEEITNKVFEYFISTVDHAEVLNNLIRNNETVDFTYRYKEDESIKLKLERLTMRKQLYKVTNDIFGMRFIVASSTEELQKIAEEFVKRCPMEDICSIADQTLGKKNDDGYKGIHVYIKPNNHVFPIEVQFWTRTHALLNQYLHDNIYKMDNEALNMYALDLRDWLERVPAFSSGDGFTVKSYVDYIYEQAFSTKVSPKDDDHITDDLDDWEFDDWMEDLEVDDKNE
jgi:ppGpp synthetase/RelA/SpoT-type nucleotidyltranferase